ncbi:biogenesis of lysosome- organelles complex 1 subunit 3 [Desmophyllum pertusum]|uniref:Biogenesis of lysosome-related organelles complex 1 subunit 3 n=1 Tax=Desmophyllum pertusum TaxID=174260 RepID=A0A9X0CLX6_9CNID|nr:biogenesis of lysosome- organelles complex 1 subunit 3 [Desmophyllum pertusum]
MQRSETPGKETQEMQGRDGISDSETDQNTTSFMRNTMVSSTMVSGEASETDDEDDDDDDDNDDNKPANEKEDKDSDTETESKHLKEEQDHYTECRNFELDTGTGVKAKRQRIIKFKLTRERNLELRSNLVEGLTQCYKSAGSKLESSTFHLSRAQTAAQDVSHNTRMMLEDLNTLSTLLDSVLGTENCYLLKLMSTIH